VEGQPRQGPQILTAHGFKRWRIRNRRCHVLSFAVAQKKGKEYTRNQHWNSSGMEKKFLLNHDSIRGERDYYLFRPNLGKPG
jgi:hypothetical protein